MYRIDEQNLPQLVYIKIGGQTGTDWIVEEGLKAGDRIVIDGLQKVVPGQPVTIKTADQKDLQPKL